MSISALDVHILSAGQEFNLRARQLITHTATPARLAAR
jgi:hypothetical protein